MSNKTQNKTQKLLLRTLYGLFARSILPDLQEYTTTNNSFKHVQKDLIARGAQCELSTMASDNCDFLI